MESSKKNTNVLNFAVVTFAIASFFTAGVSATLTLRKECGEILCKEYEYCDPLDNSCRPCSRICNRSSNNFNENRCEEGCQDHIHDERYIKNNNSTVTDLYTAQMIRDLQQDIHTLKILVGLSVCLTSICLLVVISVFIVVAKTFGCTKKLEKTKPLELPTIYNNSNNKYNGSEISPSPPSSKGPPSISNNNSVAPMKYETCPPTITHRLQREPSESTLPEYAYDNTSLSPYSPTSHHV